MCTMCVQTLSFEEKDKKNEKDISTFDFLHCESAYQNSESRFYTRLAKKFLSA